jgi:hypothetical protein
MAERLGGPAEESYRRVFAEENAAADGAGTPG